jgi:hypothetical protein
MKCIDTLYANRFAVSDSPKLLLSPASEGFLSVADDPIKLFVWIPGHLRKFVKAGDCFHMTNHPLAHCLVRERAS